MHHTATDKGSLDAIDAEHRSRKDREGKPWLGIGYHFLIGNGQGMADGLVEPTFRWKQQLHGAHAGDRTYNEEGIGICLVGNFDSYRPTPRQVAAARELVQMLAERYRIEPQNIVCHQDVGATHCPGKEFPFEEIAGHKPAKTSREPAREREPVVARSHAIAVKKRQFDPKLNDQANMNRIQAFAAAPEVPVGSELSPLEQPGLEFVRAGSR